MSEQNKNNLPGTSTTEVLNQLLELSEAMLRGDYSKRINIDVNDTTLSKICANLNLCATSLYLNPPVSSKEMESSIDNFIDVISSFSNRDFSKKLEISENSNILDAIATGINILGEELEHTTVSKEELEKERDQLKIAKEEAENANKAKTVFLGNLSHEIRTPLQGILGFSEILPSVSSPEKRKQYTEIIGRRTLELLEIIEALLDLATLESGEIRSNAELINLSGVIEKIFADFCVEYQAKISPVKLVLQNGLSTEDTIMIDPLHLRQVILNLLNNGTKFTEKGSITLMCEKHSNYYLINIIDTGIGISNEKIDLIFEPFRQVHEGFSRSKDGIGLGLPICKKRVEIWGGTIRVVSGLGRGSTFSFTIPWAESIV